MATTDPDKSKLDNYGVERSRKDDPGPLDKYRDKWPWLDHVLRMQDRYTEQGGNQYAAGITYFSVMTIFPLMMLTLAVLAMILAGNERLLNDVMDKVANMGDGNMGEVLQTIIEQSIEQRKSVFSIGLLLALWTGLGWIAHLRLGVSEMWKVDGKPAGFVSGKIKDLIGLIGLLVSLIVAFAITTIGNSGLTTQLLDAVGLADVPGIRYITFAVALLVALIANFCVFFWMILYLPRTKVPRRSAVKAAIIGAILFEVFKQFATVFFSNALSNPAGAAFGPVIGVMVLMYFIWRILLYCSAWAATTPESLANLRPDAPPAAVIRVRQEVRAGSTDANRAGLLGIGAAAGVVVGGLVTRIFKR